METNLQVTTVLISLTVTSEHIRLLLFSFSVLHF